MTYDKFPITNHKSYEWRGNIEFVREIFHFTLNLTPSTLNLAPFTMHLWSIIKPYAIWITIGSFALSIIGVWVVWWLILQLNPDHFVKEDDPSPLDRHPAFHMFLKIMRNLIGLLIILAGTAMLVLPGQGLLTIILGFSLTSFPGRRHFVNWLLEQKAVRRTMNWMRRKAHKEPLLFEQRTVPK